jgi:GTPase
LIDSLLQILVFQRLFNIFRKTKFNEKKIMFVDYAEVKLIAGIGGSGCMAFHREKYVPNGGPSGGDGGRGSHIIFEANENLSTLMDIRYQKITKGKRGEHGKGSTQHGKNAQDLIIKVPVGTVVKNKETGEVIADFVKHTQQHIIAKGGRGGKGNARFATPTDRAPRKWEYGRDGEEIDIILEVKLFADVGLVGYPNAGKSTLLSVLSGAKPKIADYPFTTLEPQLGIIEHNFRTFVMADIPGIIEGASEGKGLGHKFLRHIERTKTIAYVIDGNEEDVYQVYLTLKNELTNYSKILSEKPAIIIITKADSYNKEDLNLKKFKKIPVHVISSVARQNLDVLRDSLWTMIQEGREIYDIEPEDDEKDQFNF